MIKWLISFMMVCSLSVTVSACNSDDSPKKTENTVPEPEPNPDPTPEPVTGNGMFDLRAVKAGKIRLVGVSNYYIREMTDFLPQVTIKPVLVQNEIHPYY
ncbi:hypothetical protein F070042J6_46290 [Bacteroides sp. f07]|uniref:aldo/keto reductase n=1 Tax=Bacteroides sp. f07 TaxID=3132704 RepID=UPI0034BBED9F